MKTPRISVVFPTYNSEKYLKKAVDSILNQTFSDFEFIVIDDKSTDETLKILSEYKDPRLVVLQGPQKGLAAALNFGVRSAKGEFIARMDADDIAHETRFEKQVAYLDDNPDIGVCGTLFQEFMHGVAVHDHMENVQFLDMLNGCYVGHPTAMFRRKLFVENKLFYDETLRYSEDYDLWSRAIRIMRIGNVQENLLQYRRHAESASVANTQLMAQLDVRIKLSMIAYLVGGLSPEQETVLKKLHARNLAAGEDVETILADIINSIKYPELCANIELFYYFDKFYNFTTDFKNKLLDSVLKNITFYVISFNQLSYLKAIISFFEKFNIQKVEIIDNLSTYPPLLEYLKTLPYTVHYMEENHGHMVLFEHEKFKPIVDNEYFILTDPDVIPVDACPQDFSHVFLELLQLNINKNKVGFSLKIDDLPHHYALRTNVIAWEGRFYDKESTYRNFKIYDAPIDTTFALYRPRARWRTKDFFAAIRVGSPYAARHLPWYRNLDAPSEEDVFYKNTDKGSSNWTGTMSSEELHKKYGTSTGKATLSLLSKKEVSSHRGYFLFNSMPIVTKRTISYTQICTVIYVFGLFPAISKVTRDNKHIYKLFGFLPLWRKSVR